MPPSTSPRTSTARKAGGKKAAAAKKAPAAQKATGPRRAAAKKTASPGAAGPDERASAAPGAAAQGGSAPAAAARSPRAQVRAETLERILSIAHARLVADGADALSLRSVARELGMVSSAVYRYVASREDLLRLLAARAGDELAAAVEASTRRGRGDAGRRFTALARAVRGWALEHPGDFALLYGRVGTAAPAEGSQAGPGTGALGLPAALVGLFAEAGGSGPKVSPAARRELTALAAALGSDAGPDATARALTAWTGVAGAVAVEVSGQLAGAGSNPAALFDLQVDRIAAAAGLS